MIKENSIIIFLKSQLSAFVGGLVDFSVLIFCTEIIGIHYTYSLIIGGIVGAVVNYSINRYWAFDARQSPKSQQIPKYIVVVIGSIALKLLGTVILTEFGHIDYRISRLLIDAFVAFGFNFTLHKYWVFRVRESFN